MDTLKLCNVKELAEHLGLQISTIYAWVHTRQIPYYKIGRLVKFRADEVEQWVKERKIEMVNYD